MLRDDSHTCCGKIQSEAVPEPGGLAGPALGLRGLMSLCNAHPPGCAREKRDSRLPHGASRKGKWTHTVDLPPRPLPRVGGPVDSENPVLYCRHPTRLGKESSPGRQHREDCPLPPLLCPSSLVSPDRWRGGGLIRQAWAAAGIGLCELFNRCGPFGP